MKQLLVLAAFFTVCTAYGQIAPDKYFVEFTDKDGTPYSVQQPEQFLSPRSIERRTRQAIPTTEEDLPVNPAYVATVAGTGVTVLNRTKWFNGITIYTTDPLALSDISALPFVKRVLKSGHKNGKVSERRDKFVVENGSMIPGQKEGSMTKASGTYDYGPSYNQIHMLNGDSLHKLGYRGEGKVIAVLDAGFFHADSLPVFDSLRANHQILGTRDFVLPGNDVYQEFEHGTYVLSTMGGNLPGRLIGTAPKASYWLFRTEDVSSENYIEEYNWVSGAEVADSVGADIINSSLGYTTFYLSQWDHTWTDMNGHTTLITKGANIAASKGIAVINSAGNEGQGSWRYISAPSDGDDVLAIGAVDSEGYPASFSSHGIPGNAVKPNVAAQGRDAFVAAPDSSFRYNSGTSFSSPIIAGMVACLWQTRSDVNVQDIYVAIERSASQYNDPDTLMGYGIPDFAQALAILSVGEMTAGLSCVYPNPFTKEIYVRINSCAEEMVTLGLFDNLGQNILQKKNFSHSGENIIRLVPGDGIKPGIYILSISSKNMSIRQKLVKL